MFLLLPKFQIESVKRNIDERLFRFRADFDFGLLRVAYVVSSLDMQSGWAAKRQQKWGRIKVTDDKNFLFKNKLSVSFGNMKKNNWCYPNSPIQDRATWWNRGCHPMSVYLWRLNWTWVHCWYKNWVHQTCGDNYKKRDAHICFMAGVFQSSGQFTPERSATVVLVSCNEL